mmetsp:Transcript_5769/g.10320  ORF Transcript_5769/g.10320 Transcript_5769/m.10320 type:complete len:216 (-) Transcript_5769:162-809(-)
MYGLRRINNFYADYAGTRSDFVIVGHPEYNLGKVQSDYGYKEGWDNRGIPSLPARNMAGDRIQRMGKAAYLQALAKPSQKPKYKERALAKSHSDTQVGSRAGAGSSAGDVDAFLEELQSLERLPPCAPNRLTSGWANDIRSQPVMKHYSSVQEDLEVLRRRLQRTPSMVKAELQQDDTWRYYALYLQQAKKNGEQIRQTKQKASKMMEKAMRGTD